MQLKVNGESHSFSGRLLSELLKQLNVPDHVAVVINGTIVPRSERVDREVRDKDQIDILTLAGGG